MFIIFTIQEKWNLVGAFVLLEFSAALIGKFFPNISGEPIGTIFKGEAFKEEPGTDSLSRQFAD
jgi:hypothetical protein